MKQYNAIKAKYPEMVVIMSMYWSGLNPGAITIADLNGDGNADIVTANADSNTVSVLLGNGTGAFGPASVYGVGASSPNDVAVVDVNGDGYDDIIVGDWENQNNAVGHAYVWYGGLGGLGANGLPSNADWVATGPSGVAGNYFGLVTRGIGENRKPV